MTSSWLPIGEAPPSPPTPPPLPGSGPVLDNCEPLDSGAQVSWSVDKEKEEITFQLCSCETTQNGY